MEQPINTDPRQPDPKLKGIQGGNCNREACQRPGAQYFNTSTLRYYCAACAQRINEDNRENLCRVDLVDGVSQFKIIITPEQKVQLDGLNAIWNCLSSAEGLAAYRVILGRQGLALILEAARTGSKVIYTEAPEVKPQEQSKPPLDKQEGLDKQGRFHAHLDICAQCADHPFSLCPVGHSILIGS